MARTKDQSFVNRYLNQYQSNQQAAVSAGQQAASSAANSGVSTMTQAAQNINVPSLYDYTSDLMEMVVDQQEAQIKAQQAAAKAAQKEAEKAKKEAQKEAEEKYKAQKKAAEETMTPTAPAQKTSRYPKTESPLSYEDSISQYTSATKSAQEYADQRKALEKERDQLASKIDWGKEEVTGFQSTDGRRYSQLNTQINALKLRESAAQEKADTAMTAVKSAIKELPDDERIAIYLDPSYKLSKDEEKDAKKLIEQLRKSVKDTIAWGSGATDEERQAAFDLQTQADNLESKISNLDAFFANAYMAFPGIEPAADYLLSTGDEYDPETDSVAARMQPQRTQNPIASTAGSIGGTLASYAVGGKVAKSIPVLNTGLQKAGQALGGTSVAQKLSRLPILGAAFTPSAITDILGDQIVDTVLDTGVGVAANAVQGDKSAAQIAQDAAASFGGNLAANIVSAGVLGTAGDWLAKRRAARQAANSAQDASLPALDDAARQTAETVQEAPSASAGNAVPNVATYADTTIVDSAPPTLPENLLVEKWRSGTLTNADIETLKPGGENRAAFEAKTGMQLPSTSSETRRFLKQEVPSLNNTQAEQAVLPMAEEQALSDNRPNTVGAKEAEFGYQEVPSQSRAVNSVDSNYMSEIDIDNQGGQRQYTHQRISHEEQLKRAENIRQTESDDEIISRISAKQENGGSINAEDSVTIGRIVEDMNKRLSDLDDTSEEYTTLMRRKLYAQDVWQRGQSDVGRALESSKIFTTPEKAVMQAQRSISNTTDAVKNAHGKEFGKLEDVVKKAVEDAEQSAEQAAKKELSAAQRLANRVSQTVPSNSTSKIDPNAQVLNSMVNELFGVAKESPLPQAVKNSKNLTAADKIKLAYENADQYRETWEQAKAIVADKFASNEDALYLLDSYLKNLGDGGLYSAKTVSRAVGDAAKELNIDFKKLAKQYSIDKDAAIQSLTDKLISDVGVDGADAAELADRVMVAYNQQMQQAVEANLREKFKELFEGKHAKQKQQAIDNFMQLLNMGVYNNDTVKQLVASKYGIAPLSTEQAGQIQAIMEKAQQFPQKSMERWELQNQAAAIAAENINTSLLDKWNAWRYMSMLGNVRTNEKNVIGNVAQGTLARAKEFVQGAFYEPVADAISKAVKGEGIQRTTAVMNPILNKSDRALLSAGLLDADTSVYSDLVGNSEFFDITKQMGRNRRVFQNEAMERARKGISAALEGADYSGALGTLDFIKEISPKGSRLRDMAESVQEWGKQFPGFAGLRNNYAWSLAEYLKANKVGTEIFDATDEASQKLLTDARAWAIRQALENTYHEQAIVSDIMSATIKRLMDAKKPGATSLALALQGVLPFTKAPANVFKQAVRYSPAGFAKAILPNVGAYAKQTAKWAADKNLRAGGMDSLVEFLKLTEKADLSESLDAASKATVGTVLVAIGALLRSNGVLTASMSDQEKAAAASTGQQEYAINWKSADGTRKSYTIDWLSPISLPMFIGAEFYDSMVENGEGVGNAVASAYTAMLDPLTEMSFLSSVNNILDTYNRVNQSEDSEALAAGAALLTAGTSYFTQGIPTIGGQFARAVDDTRRSTYSGSTGFLNALDYQLTQAENRIPGLSMTNQPYIDQWGQEEKNTGGNFIGRLAFNMFSPGYYASAEYDPTVSALESLNSASAFPKTSPSKTVTYKQNGEDVTHRWTPEEYTQYSQSLGQGSKDLADALTSNPAYLSLPSDEQLELVSDIYSLANRSARRDVVPYLNDEFLAAVESGDMDKQDRLDNIYEQQGADAIVPYLVADQIIGGITGDKNAKGNTIPGSAKKNKINALIEKGFTRAEAEELYELLNG